MKTYKVIVRYVGLELDSLQGKTSEEMTIKADGMAVIENKLTFYVNNQNDEAVVVAIFSYWEYVMEVEQA